MYRRSGSAHTEDSRMNVQSGLVRGIGVSRGQTPCTLSESSVLLEPIVRHVRTNITPGKLSATIWHAQKALSSEEFGAQGILFRLGSPSPDSLTSVCAACFVTELPFANTEPSNDLVFSWLMSRGPVASSPGLYPPDLLSWAGIKDEISLDKLKWSDI